MGIISYHIYSIYSDRQAWASNVDPDETLQNAASHQGLHYLPICSHFLEFLDLTLEGGGGGGGGGGGAREDKKKKKNQKKKNLGNQTIS